MISVSYDYFENGIILQIITITDYDYPRSGVRCYKNRSRISLFHKSTDNKMYGH